MFKITTKKTITEIRENDEVINTQIEKAIGRKTVNKTAVYGRDRIIRSSESIANVISLKQSQTSTTHIQDESLFSNEADNIIPFSQYPISIPCIQEEPHLFKAAHNIIPFRCL